MIAPKFRNSTFKNLFAIVMTFGAIIGSRLAILKGNKFIKPVFLVVTIVLILKMSVEIFF